MLFDSKTCPKCESVHDALLDYCPSCHTRNEENEKYRVTFLPVTIEVFLLLLGIVGFILFSVLFSLIFASIYDSNKLQGEMLISLSSYLLFFAFVIVLLFPYGRNLLLKLKSYQPYIAGILGCGVLIAGSYFLSFIATTINPNIGTGDNQTSVVQLTQNYPAFAIIIFGFIGPICEEAAYRLGLFTFFKRIRPWLAYLVTGIVFGLIHFNFLSKDIATEFLVLPNYIWGGILFSLLYDKFGIGASVTAHIANNLLQVILIIAGVS